MWLLGVPWAEAHTAGALMGTKTVLNKLIAYLDLARLPADALCEHSRLILIYALCGFANFGSLGIMLGGLGTMVGTTQRDRCLGSEGHPFRHPCYLYDRSGGGSHRVSGRLALDRL